MPGVLSKTSPENGQPRIAQNGFSSFSTMFYIFTLRNQIRCIMLSFHYNKNHTPKHKGKAAEMAQADAEEVMM
jgi:hypothetical protein